MTIQTATRIHPEFTIGDRLRKARSLLGPDMDVRRFSELIETSKNTVTNYELEKTDPEKMKPIIIKAWAMATGVDYNWLMYGKTIPENGGGNRENVSNLRPTDYKVGASANYSSLRKAS